MDSPNATQSDVPEGVLLARRPAPSCRPVGWRLGYHDDRRVLGAEPALHPVAHLGDVERHLGDQDHVGATGHPGVQRDPASVAAHHLDDQRPVVRLGGGVQPVDRLGGNATAVSKPNV